MEYRHIEEIAETLNSIVKYIINRVLKQRYHYLGETDAIDIHHFLYIKHLGILETPIPMFPVNFDLNSQYPSGDKITSLADEIALLQFEM